MRLERADAMARRLIATARRHGLDTDEAASVGITFDRIVRLRWPALDDERHVDHLHPARTALILLDDVGLSEPAALRAALLHDSLNPNLVPDATLAAEIAGTEAAALLRSLPAAEIDDAERIERLVTADPVTLDIALAERLDHARHIHLRDDVDRAGFLAAVERVHLPLARRRGGLLAKRYERLLSAVSRREKRS